MGRGCGQRTKNVCAAQNCDKACGLFRICVKSSTERIYCIPYRSLAPAASCVILDRCSPGAASGHLAQASPVRSLVAPRLARPPRARR
eukprot:scaffold130264_cov69-Phaeocystis_antarctica.AAC.1